MESEKVLMKQNVLGFEPDSALFVEDDKSLKYYEHILNFSFNSSNPIGQIYFEINNIKRKALENILNKNNQLKSEFFKDSFKKTRFLKVQF